MQMQNRHHTNCYLLLVIMLVLTSCEMTFDEFTVKFHKSYPNAQQRARRNSIYNANVLQIQTHNNNPQSMYKQAVTTFTDRTDAELSRPKLPKIDLSKAQNNSLPKIGDSSKPFPATFNWRDQGKISSVKDQDKCGACWVFVATAAASSYLAIQTGSIYELSEQYVLECTMFGGCNGGYTELAFNLMISKKTPLLSTFPYTAGLRGSFQPTQGICSTGQGIQFPPNTIVNTYYNVSSEKLKELIMNGPVAAMYYGTERAFSSYSTGIYSCGMPTVGTELLDHALEVIGWDSASNFIVKNSWGTTWGAGGFGVISKDRDCGLKLIVYELYRKGDTPIAPNNNMTPNTNPATNGSSPPPDNNSSAGGRGYIIKRGQRTVVALFLLFALIFH